MTDCVNGRVVAESYAIIRTRQEVPSMDSDSRSLCEALARAIVERDFDGAHALFAPWLRATVSPTDIQQTVDDRSAELPHPPHSWTTDEGLVGLDDLREPDPYGPPSRPLPDQITAGNFRGWFSIQLAPDPAVHDEQNVCYDVWLAAVEHDGALKVGYFEPWEAG
jgi:hypothetical protein